MIVADSLQTAVIANDDYAQMGPGRTRNNEGVHTVLNSYDILGGPATFNVVWASSRFREKNPLIYQAFVETLEEAIGVINADTEAAVDTYVRLSGDASTPELVRQIITDPQVSYTTTPNNIGKYLDFMTRIGTLKQDGATWQDVFFENVHGKQGS